MATRRSDCRSGNYSRDIFFGAVSFAVSFFDSSGKTQAAVAKGVGQVLLLVSGVS